MTLLRRPYPLVFAVAWLAVTASGRPLVAQQSPRAGLDVVKVAQQVHLIAGDGGNIAVQTGPDGVVVVDSGAGQRSDDVLAAIRGLSDRPIRYILNTSASLDRVGGNQKISVAGEALAGAGGAGGGPAPAAVVAGVRTGAARLAHENVLLRMSAPLGEKPAFPEAAWPTEGFIDKKDMYLNGEAILMIHQPRAHSDGDAIVFFRRSDVIVTGSIVDVTRFPVIAVAAGGSVQGLIDALNFLIDLAVPPTPLVWQDGGTQIIPGRGRVMEEADLVEYRDMVTIVRDIVQDGIKKGMTLEQIRATEPTRGYTRRYGSDSGPWTTRMFVDAVYASLTKGGSR